MRDRRLCFASTVGRTSVSGSPTGLDSYIPVINFLCAALRPTSSRQLNPARPDCIQATMLSVAMPIDSASAPLSPLPVDETAEWVRSAAAGNAAAFERLYRAHVKRVHAVIWRLVGGVQARAEELTQEAFVRAWQALPGFRGDSAFGTWLHRLEIGRAHV